MGKVLTLQMTFTLSFFWSCGEFLVGDGKKEACGRDTRRSSKYKDYAFILKAFLISSGLTQDITFIP